MVRDVDTNLEEGKIEFVGFDDKVTATCPDCGTKCGRYDTRKWSWGHLDTMQYRTALTADVPRVACTEHGVKTVKVRWAEAGSRFTAPFERLAMDRFKETCTSAVARVLRMSWDEADGIMSRAVTRGMARRTSQPLRHIGLDETSFQKRYEYVTVVYDTERARVVEVLDGRKQATLENFYWDTPYEHLATIETVSMDMWSPYINATLQHVPDAETKISFDRFHIAKHETRQPLPFSATPGLVAEGRQGVGDEGNRARFVDVQDARLGASRLDRDDQLDVSLSA